MYARLARFSGVDPGTSRERAARLREEVEAVWSGDLPEEMPEQAAEVLRAHVVRVLAFGGSGDEELSLVFTETEDGMRAVDRVLDTMTPPGGDGRRSDVETFEVLVDVAPR